VIDVLKRAQDMGIRVIRTWGFGDGCEDYHQEACKSWSRYFQPAPGVYNASAFEHFDRIVYEAGKRDIRLIIALANNWGEYGGIPRYVCWQKGMGADCPGNFMTDLEHDTFYTDGEIKEWYRQYVAHFVTHENTLTGVRYADDPTIMAWELINEPRAKSDPDGSDLHQWIVEMSGYVAGLAPNQLIGTGEEGWFIMPQTQATDFEPWQDFPKNYWHYGVNWVVNDPSCKEVWGSNGADFISDNSTNPRTVTWHEETYAVTPNKTVSSEAISEERAAVPKVDFTGIHLYPAPDGTNLARAPYCEYYGLDSLCSLPSDPAPAHQARAWIKQHVEASHNDLNKPFLLEEFNFSDLEKRIPGEDPKYEKVTVTKDERALLFSQYLDFAYDLDVDGVLFWNLGYELGSDVFNHQSWNELDALQAWKPEDIVTKSEQGIQLNYGTDPAATQTTMTLSNPQVHWFRVDEGKVSVEVDNVGDAQTVWIEVQWAKGPSPQPLELSLIPGKNTLDLTKLFNTPEDEPGNQDAAASSCNEPKQPPPAVTMVKVTVQDYTSPGTATFSFKTIFNNKYVIYPEDPVEEVIRLAAPQWQQRSAVAQASVKIDRSLICNGDTRIHPELLNGGLPIRFDFVGSIEHPDGYYYRYLVKSPGDQGQSNFGNLGGNSSGQILIEAPVPGKYQVSIAPEGVNFEDPEADSCHFQVTNSAPTLHVDALRVDGEVAESPDDTVRTGFALFRISRDIDISLSGTDDVSPSLAIKCRFLKDGKEVQDNPLSCHSSLAAATQKGAIGQSISIRGVLPPGQYQLELTAGDEESAEVSEALEIEVFNPWYIYLGGLVLLLLIAYLVWWARVRPKSPKRA
jgi:hypothetical protein